MSASNLKNFFKKIWSDQNFDFISQVSNEFSLFFKEKMKNNQNLQNLYNSLKNSYFDDFSSEIQENSNDLIEFSKVFENFFLERILKKKRAEIFKNLLIQEKIHSDFNHDTQKRKDFLNSFKDLGYFNKFNFDSANHLRKEFKDFSIKNNFSSDKFEGFRDNKIISANLEACLICHERKKDSCRTGFSKNNFETSGCPLKIHISEAIFLKRSGFHLASLLMIMINNPLCVFTGFRICNDCNKGCIFSASKIEPIDVSSLESKILSDILTKINFGPEIYLFFLIFNPLYLIFSKNIVFLKIFFENDFDFYKDEIVRNSQKKKILIVGAGVSGISAAFNFFIRENQSIHLIDSGKFNFNQKRFKRFLKYPIKNGQKFFDFELGKRGSKNSSGFGGVCEYGITNRWNKNNLDLIFIFFLRLKKLRHKKKDFLMSDSIFFSDFSGFGPTEAFKEFDIVLFSTGASKQNWPKWINFKKNDYLKPKNIFFAADFLIDKNLKNNENLSVFSEIRGAVGQENFFSYIIIGFGLTAVDTANMLIKNFFDSLKANNKFFENIDEFNYEKKQKILEKFGFRIGIIYSKSLEESSAFRTNHEEISFLLSQTEKSVEILSNKRIISIIESENKNSEIIIYDNLNNSEEKIFCGKIFIATGFSQNNVLFKENNLNQEKIIEFLSQKKENIFLDYEKVFLGRSFSSSKNFIGFIGDAHPAWRGSVVLALASSLVSISEFKKIEFNLENSSNSFIKNFKKPTIKSVKFFKKLGLVQLILNNIPDFMVKNFFPGKYFKFWKDSNAIHLTPIMIFENEIHFLIKDFKSKWVEILSESSKEVSILGPLGDKISFLSSYNTKKIFFLGSKFALYSKIPIFQKLIDEFKGSDILVFYIKTSINSNKSIKFYEKKLEKFKSKILFFETSEFESLKIFNNFYKNTSVDLIFDDICDEFVDVAVNSCQERSFKIFRPISIKLGCSMKGLCGKCFILKNDKKLSTCFLCSTSQIFENSSSI